MNNRFLNQLSLISCLSFLLSGCLKEKLPTEVPMIDLEMKENGRYYLKGKADPYQGVGYHEKNGQRISQSVFVDGFRDGEHIVYWPDTGKQRTIGPYREGFRHGTHTDWDKEGARVSESTYEDGALVGPYRSWYPRSGAIKEEGRYVKGKRQGKWIIYFNDIDLAFQEPDDRRKSEEANYDKGNLHGLKQNWNINGLLVLHSSHDHGRLNGRQEAWYPSGVKKESYYYDNGRPAGNHQEWHPNGQKKYDAIFTQDGVPGKEQFWDANGKSLEYHPDEIPEELPEGENEVVGG